MVNIKDAKCNTKLFAKVRSVSHLCLHERKRMPVYRFFIPLTQHDVAVLLCEWAISAYGVFFFFFELLAETLHQQASRSQLPRLDVHQTQQIKNGTDQCQNTINHSSSVVNLTQTWACLLSQTFNCLMEKYTFVKYLLLGVLLTLTLTLLTSFLFSQSLWIIYTASNSFPENKK